MNVVPDTLVLLTTYQCTAACDHCCVSCGPKVTKYLPFETMKDAISAAHRFGHFNMVCFTGGECFLLHDRLINLVKHATDKKFVTRCMTNGYWAVNEKGAKARLEPLVQAGLKE